MIGSNSCINLFFSVRRFLSVLIVRMLLLFLIILMLDQRCFDVLFLLSVQGLWILDIEFDEHISELIRIGHQWHALSRNAFLVAGPSKTRKDLTLSFTSVSYLTISLIGTSSFLPSKCSICRVFPVNASPRLILAV